MGRTLWKVIPIGLSLCRLSSGTATSSVICSTDQWTANSQGQTPCLVGASLEAPCTGGIFNVDPLPPGQRYGGPIASNKCQCSTVTYSLISACGACQGQNYIHWSEWTVNCTTTDVSITSYPFPIPEDLVPKWAFLNVTKDNIWNITQSLISHNEEIIGSTSTTATSTSSSVDSTATIILPMPSTLAGASGDQQAMRSVGSLRDGVIAASAVGGFLLLCLIAIAVIILLKRRQKRLRQKAGGDPTGILRYEKSDPRQPHLMQYNRVSAIMEEEPQTLYDPADPRTFPPTPPFDYRSPQAISDPRPQIFLHGLNEYSYARRSGPLSAMSP